MGFRSIFVSFLACIIFTACNGNNDAGASNVDSTVVEAVVDTVVPIEIDSVAIKQEEKKADSIRISNIASAEEAIEYMKNSPDSDKYEEGVLIAMARQSLDYTKRLLQNEYDYFIVVDKPSMYVVLFDKFGREKQSYKMACARNYGTKHKRSDCRTPEGFFSAEGIYNSTDWLYTDDNGYTSPTRGVYGPRFIRLNTPVTRTVGIHGTNGPGSLGRRASHGCIRLHNNSILDLVKYARKGMPVIVNPSDRDQEVNRKEGYKVVQINIGKPKVTQPIENPKDKSRGEEGDSLPMAIDSIKTAAPANDVIAHPAEPDAEPATPASPQTPAPSSEPEVEA